MNITRCRECGNEISTEAKNCPYCGAPNPLREKQKGSGFEWQSSQTFYGYPIVHIAFGRDEKNKLKIAKGIIAIGQFGIGLITFAQFGVGILFGLGQVMLGTTAIAQCAISVLFGIGQLSTGYIAIGQISLGFYALCQAGFAKYILTPETKDPEALEFFLQLLDRLKHFLT
jgi:ribosomal protein L40E